ncbi:MAG: choice-of-anchor Q domain-containing protein [Candidatus Hodarchaeota archaeon]
MKRILVKKIIVVAFLVFLAGVSRGAVFCVSTAMELQNALDTAETNGEDDIIQVVQGTYSGNFYYYSSEGCSITLLGGYTSDCADRVVDPSYTVLDGGGSGMVLRLNNSNGGDILIEGFTIQNGAGNDYGVGVYAQSQSDSGAAGNVTLNNNIIKGNTATGNYIGGGVSAWSRSDSDPTGNVILTNNIITGNTSGGWAGGVSAGTYSQAGIAGDVIATNNIITGNTAYDYGGGIEAVTNSPSGTAGNIILTNNTITENTANSGGGGLSIYLPANRNLYVYNNIIWGNMAPVGGDIYIWPWGPGIPNGYNNDYSDMYGSWTNSGNNINEDPFFVGGDNYRLQDISPCIDAGDNFAPELPVFDFDGNPRIMDGDSDGNAIVDMGAYEFEKLTPEEKIENLIDDIIDKVNSGELNKGSGNALNSKLERALERLNAGNTIAACNLLRAFVHQVNAFIRSGFLTEEEAQVMIDAANEVINELCG